MVNVEKMRHQLQRSESRSLTTGPLVLPDNSVIELRMAGKEPRRMRMTSGTLLPFSVGEEQTLTLRPVEPELPWYWEGDRRVHTDCGGEVMAFKEGPICTKCEASSDWVE